MAVWIRMKKWWILSTVLLSTSSMFCFLVSHVAVYSLRLEFSRLSARIYLIVERRVAWLPRLSRSTPTWQWNLEECDAFWAALGTLPHLRLVTHWKEDRCIFRFGAYTRCCWACLWIGCDEFFAGFSTDLPWEGTEFAELSWSGRSQLSICCTMITND